ncbi:putative mediator of RNA polymerase II transcription subunit 26b [Tasmannia lanceolata]|uniref:putative mediator of RNA polymerase II transcription subunit 26b n=1 Tax=Tasmannia lanceolata TaxID=3420 RepID=UPI00406313EF
MEMKSSVLDYWRKYFRSANSDIFDVIEYAIVVAASDCPKEFRMRRDRIAEKLFSCRISRCLGCDRVEVAVPEEDDGGFKGGLDGAVFGGKESKVNSSTTERGEINGAVTNFSYDEAEALTEEIEEESQIFGEVQRIKGVLCNSQDESDSVLFESLRRLQLMALSVEILKATEIGKAVNGMRKHGSKQIRNLARTLIDGWKDMVDQWVDAAAAIAKGSPDSVNPSIVDEEGLPSPPLDEGAFLTTSIELSQFFDGMDDDGNPRNGGEFDKNCENRRKPMSENKNFERKPQNPREANLLKEDKNQLRKQEDSNKQTKASNPDWGPGRPPKLSSEHKANKDTIVPIQNIPPSSIQDKSKNSDELSVRVKLEAAKRKLQEGYQQAENAKKQRTIQVMDLCDIPKQGLGQKNFHAKPGTHNRHWANGRR